ncbi:protoheme IX farnesyltransferase [Actinoplanes derwentensis]|uniref:Protoheme IX farnesyltransferase n=2 Tax=Actinoplanes derwentensis TaxID=113562 RepID=A0A1H2BWS4_9ACTN|nr:heme o synthase [Actinoplanes derwentensis]GID83129.1 protoheme IX farnesyltransferase [Actinoplanes derwentensis]SDT62206.1 protoheme IX farnesyltransferase [Actinoplanes derwentensis]
MITERPLLRRTPGAAERPVREPGTGGPRHWLAVFRAYLVLTKPQIVELLLVTTVPTMMLAAGGWPDPVTFTAVLVGGALAGGGASVLNCYIDRDIDQLMRRTKRRPLPANQLTPRAVLIFGLTLSVISVALMAVLTNWLATALTAFSIFYYDVVYTLWLKRRTPANTFWGGVCGAAPVVIGWAAVTDSIPPMAWALFAIVFFWQMPHFYALAIKYKDDYARAGIPMLPVVRSMKRVNFEIILYTVLTVISSLAAWPLGLGPIYGVTAVVMGAIFLGESIRLVRQTGGGAAVKPMRLFHLSITYLTVLFMAVAIDALV